MDITPSYEQKSFSDLQKKNKLLTVVSSEKNNEALYIHQESKFLLGNIETGKSVEHKIEGENIGVYVFLIGGKIQIGKEELKEGDAAQITQVKEIKINSVIDSKVLVIEVPT